MPCDIYGTKCEIAFDEYKAILRENGAKTLAAALRDTTNISQFDVSKNDFLSLNLDDLMRTLLYCATKEPHIYLAFVNLPKHQLLLEQAGRHYGTGPDAFFAIGRSIAAGEDAAAVKAAFIANVAYGLRFSTSVADATIEQVIDTTVFAYNLSGQAGNVEQQKAVDAAIQVLTYLKENPKEASQQVVTNLATLVANAARGDAEALGSLTGGAIWSIIPAGVATRALTNTRFSHLAPDLEVQGNNGRSDINDWLDATNNVPDRIIVRTNAAGDSVVSIQGAEMSIHASRQATTRGISNESIAGAMDQTPFQYRQNGDILNGFYDASTNTFVGVGNRITTVIRPSNPDNYLNNLRNRQ